MVTLHSRTIDGEREGPHLLITGGVHGDEYEPMAAIRRLIEQFDPAGLSGHVTLVPVVNEPAFLRRSRTAEDELDLARICPGRDDGSVTEQIAAALSRLIETADYYIDLHTGGIRYDILPLTGYGLNRNPEILETQRRMARTFNLPIVWGTNDQLEGRSLSVARAAAVPAIYTEYGGGAICRPDGVDAYVNGCLNVARELGMLNRPVPETKVQYVVEDDREQSGHLQVQLPAPIDGFFEPHVSLGDVVKTDQVIGTVGDPLGERRIDLPAPHNGTVLFLTTTPAVNAGESVGGLLPIIQPGEVRIAIPAD